MLRALGGSPSQTIADSFFCPFAAVLVGAVLAIVVACARRSHRSVRFAPSIRHPASRSTGRWSASVAPSPGADPWRDRAVPSYRVAPQRISATGEGSRSKLRVASRVGATGMPISAVTGVRLRWNEVVAGPPCRSAPHWSGPFWP